MRHFVILLTVTLSSLAANAQSAEDSVKTVINTMFTAMRTADTKLLASVFADSMILQSVGRNKEGATVIRTESAADFLSSVGKLANGDADERISFDAVKVDGPMAMAWTPYQFYYKGNFSHCGVNSFQLVRFNGVWKVQYIIDTRRRQGCQ